MSFDWNAIELITILEEIQKWTKNWRGKSFIFIAKHEMGWMKLKRVFFDYKLSSFNLKNKEFGTW